MKKILFLLALGLQLASCHIAENVEIREDGSGTMASEIDASELMQMAGDQFEGALEGALGVTAKDTVISFKDIFAGMADSIAQLSVDQQASLRAMEPYRLKLQSDQASGTFKMTLLADFKSVSELIDMTEAMNKLQAAKSCGGPDATFSKLNYAYDGKKFKRSVAITNPELFKKTTDSLAGILPMLGSSTYTLKYTFPKKIKSVSNQKATLSPDGKTVTVPYTFQEYMIDPESMNLEITFK